jgi:elongator complex protein 3
VPDTHLRRHRNAFDPTPYERDLVGIVEEILAAPEVDDRVLDRIAKNHPKDGKGLFSRSEIIAGFRRFAPQRSWNVDEAEFVERLRMRPVRTQSGVTPVSVLTKPYPCPGECIFCPNDVRMPKSYLSGEPGAQRAEDNAFDPYLQTWNRLAALRSIGHPVDKVELIVLGGTWSFHPESYQIWYVKRCFDALNDFGAGIDLRDAAGVAPVRFGAAAPIDGRAAEGTSYNRAIRSLLAAGNSGSLLHPSETASWSELERAQRANETAACRSVGLAVETRPDQISEAEVLRIRRLGGTKVQIGIQSLSDRVLALNRRGHDVAATRRALRLLRSAGFKIHAHWMPNLCGASPEADVADYARLFDDVDFRPDEIKIYPCSLVASAELMAYHERGEWRPYGEAELLGVLTASLAHTPPYCRITRVIRDFSADDIVVGNKVANLREVAERALQREGGVCRDIRAREIKRGAFRPEELALVEVAYETSSGDEVFFQYVTPDDRLVAFLRLSLPRGRPATDELAGSAIVREVHVYGTSLPLSRRSDGKAQHLGLGRKLIDRARERAGASGYADLAVISAVGTRAYYRSLGFRDGPLYQHRRVSGSAQALRNSSA